MLAPNQVSAPAAIQTSSIPLNDGTALLTSDGWTKIDDPTMVPTNMAVACVRPIDRSSLDDIRGASARLKARPTHVARGFTCSARLQPSDPRMLSLTQSNQG